MITKEKDSPILKELKSQMQLIPAGKFAMGAEAWGEYESPIHEVFVDNFYIDIHQVTNEEFNEFVSITGYKTSAEDKGSAKGYENSMLKEIAGLNWKSYFTEERKNHPVVLVSWYDAVTYATWAGKRLPSEAEWEKAARGGLESKLYPWGDDTPLPGLCNFGKTTTDFPATMEVKSFPPNNYGLYDMCGNVWNWCNDWFSESSYNIEENQNPKGPKTGTTKVRRGASFNIIQTFRLRTSNRGAYDPKSCAINIGFRCVKDI